MNLKLYECNADNRMVDKSSYLNEIFTFENAILKSDSSVMNIEIILQLTNFQLNQISNCNYVYLEDINTYYFINDISFLSGNRALVNCSEDVLMTYRNQIKQLMCVIERQENLYNTYLDDEEYKVYNYRRIQTLEFPKGFNSNNSQFIVAIAGGD